MLPTGTGAEVIPVVKLDGRASSAKGKPGPITGAMLAKFPQESPRRRNPDLSPDRSLARRRPGVLPVINRVRVCRCRAALAHLCRTGKGLRPTHLRFGLGTVGSPLQSPPMPTLSGCDLCSRPATVHLLQIVQQDTQGGSLRGVRAGKGMTDPERFRWLTFC